MARQIYVNLPVKDVQRARDFFVALGFGVNEQFSNENAVSVVISEEIYAMLLAESFFATFTDRPVADARQSTEVLVCLSCESRAEVDALVSKALAAGGSAPRDAQDHGFMYQHGFEDPDGHIWELVYMEPGGQP